MSEERFVRIGTPFGGIAYIKPSRVSYVSGVVPPSSLHFSCSESCRYLIVDGNEVWVLDSANLMDFVVFPQSAER